VTKRNRDPKVQSSVTVPDVVSTVVSAFASNNVADIGIEKKTIKKVKDKSIKAEDLKTNPTAITATDNTYNIKNTNNIKVSSTGVNYWLEPDSVSVLSNTASAVKTKKTKKKDTISDNTANNTNAISTNAEATATTTASEETELKLAKKKKPQIDFMR
jgi:hypothetical protein